MKRKYIVYGIVCLLFSAKVNALACPFETQVAINNDAGSVSVNASPFEYEFTDKDTENDEEYSGTAYTGLVHVYNLTPNIYAVATDGVNKITINYDEDSPNQVTFSTGGMAYLKEYKISIYPTNTNCGKTAVRELNVTVPRLNRYYSYDSCSDYPDYFYCSQFLSVDDISEEDFINGLNEYAKNNKSKKEENRQEGILNETKDFVKEHWLIITIIAVIAISGIGTFVFLKRKKRKEHIV